MDRIQGSMDREIDSERMSSEMDKVMNEEFHLAGKKEASNGEEFTQRGAKKRKNEGSEKYVRIANEWE